MKKALSILLCAVLLITGMTCFSVTASATSSDSPEIFMAKETSFQDWYIGDNVSIKVLYEQLWQYQYLCCYVFDADDNQVAYSDAVDNPIHGSTYGYYNYTFGWDTTGKPAGKYTVEIYLFYYDSNGAQVSDYYASCVIDLKKPSQKPSNGWKSIGGKWVYYDGGKKVMGKWMRDSIGWCYLGYDGYMATNEWVEDSNDE